MDPPDAVPECTSRSSSGGACNVPGALRPLEICPNSAITLSPTSAPLAASLTPKPSANLQELCRVNSGLDPSDALAVGLNTPPKGGQLLGFCAVEQPRGSVAAQVTPPSNASLSPAMTHPSSQLSLEDRALPVIVCGPMGAGKTALLQRIIEGSKEQVEQCVSVVAYDRRYSQRGHKNTLGKYDMVPVEEFREMEQRNEFMEVYSDTQRKIRYGIRYSEVRRIQTAGLTPVIDVDQRALPCFVENHIPARYIYILPPSEGELEYRLSEMRVMKKSISQKEKQTALMEYSKREEIINILMDETKDHPERLFVLENNDYDLAFTQLKAYVLSGRIMTNDEAIEIQQKPATLHGVTIIIEPSGIGGSRFINRLRDEGVGVAVSHTTRDPKPGEENGRHYHYVSQVDFRRKCLLREFLEYAQVGGHYYGTTKQEFKRVLASHSHVVIKVNVRGAQSVKSVQIGARFVLLSHGHVDSPQARQERRNRWEAKEGPLSDEEVERREGTLREEMLDASELPFCDLVVDVSSQDSYERLRDFVLKGKSDRSKKDTKGHLKVPREEADETVRRRTGTLRTGTVMKADHFPSGKQRGLKESIDGAPNFRHVADGPDPLGSRHQHAFFGMAQPTYSGMLSVMMRILRNRGHTRALVVNLREERVLYINGNPFCLKNLQDLYHNVEDEISVAPDRIEAQEDGLKSGILQESRETGGGFLVHDEEFAPGELAAYGETFAYNEPIKDKTSVLTPRQVVEQVSEQLSASVRYVRLPITDEQPPKDEDLDILVREFWKLHVDSPSGPIVFNCQLGRGRTTTAMLLCLLFLFPPQRAPPAALREDELVGGTLQDPDSTATLRGGTVADSSAHSSAPLYARSGSIVGMEITEHPEATRETRWQCVRSLFDDMSVPHRTEVHFLRVIEATDHIQNLRHCVEEAYDRCARAVDPEKKQKLWRKTRNYLRRYYYLAMAATYFETQCVGKYKRWRNAVQSMMGDTSPIPDTGSPPISPQTDPITSPECGLEAPPFDHTTTPGTAVLDAGLCSTQPQGGRRERRGASSHNEEPLRVGFKLWINAEALWDRCEAELHQLKEKLGIETPEDERGELEHSGRVTAVEPDGKGVWIRANGLHEAVFAPIELIRNLSTPVMRHQDASAAPKGLPPLSLSPTLSEMQQQQQPARLPSSSTLDNSSIHSGNMHLSHAFCGMQVRFALGGRDAFNTISHLNLSRDPQEVRVAVKVLRDPVAHVSPPLLPSLHLGCHTADLPEPQEQATGSPAGGGAQLLRAQSDLSSPALQAQGGFSSGFCAELGPHALEAALPGGADLQGGFPTADSGVGLQPSWSSVSLGTGGSGSVTTPLHTGGSQVPRFDAVFYAAGEWQSFCAAFIIWHTTHATGFRAYAVAVDDESHVQFFQNAVEARVREAHDLQQQQQGEAADPPAPPAVGCAASAFSGTSPAKRKRRGKILVIGRRLQDMLKNSPAVAALAEKLPAATTTFVESSDLFDEERKANAAKRENSSVWVGPCLVTIAWDYIRVKCRKAVTWSSLPPFFAYVEALDAPKKKPAEVTAFRKGLEQSEWCAFLGSHIPHETHGEVFTQFSELISGVVLQKLIEYGQRARADEGSALRDGGEDDDDEDSEEAEESDEADALDATEDTMDDIADMMLRLQAESDEDAQGT